MGDLIDRQDAIDAVDFGITCAFEINKDTGEMTELFSESNEQLRQAMDRIEQLPSAEPTQFNADSTHFNAEPCLDEWCTDCSEYDHEKHSCPRWNRVIRSTLEDAQPEIIRCKNCIYFDRYVDGIEKYQWDGFCADWARNTYEDWFCSRAERRTDGDGGGA